MATVTKVVEIPDFQSPESLLDFLLGEFMFMQSMGGMILLTNDDLRILTDTLQRFMNNSTRSDSRTVTDDHEKEDN